jgi:hypothetical protein
MRTDQRPCQLAGRLQRCVDVAVELHLRVIGVHDRDPAGLVSVTS